MTSGTDILLIEDEPNIAEAIRFILSREGWRLQHWHEGGEALDRVRALRPRLLILDVMLPVRSGLEVLDDLRADPAVGATPVLLLTARGVTGRSGVAPEAADRVLAKPFDNSELRQMVREMLDAAG